MRGKKFKKISQSLGRFSVAGALSIVQLSLASLGLFFAVAIDYYWKIGLIAAAIFVTGLLIPIAIVVGERPDRWLRAILSRPSRWKRGFEPARPLLAPRKSRKFQK